MLIKNINLLQNLIVAGLLTLVSGDCTKQVFFLENSAYQPQKGDTRIRNPGYYWKHNVILNGYGDEIYEKLGRKQIRIYVSCLSSTIWSGGISYLRKE